jgi:WD40 repeat protein
MTQTSLIPSSSSSKAAETKPLFILQHSPSSPPSVSTNKGDSRGHDVSSLCFLGKNEVDSDNNNNDGICDDNDSSSDSDSSVNNMDFQCRSKLFNSKLYQHTSAVAHATTLSFQNVLLTACHTNGNAFIFDLSQRAVVREIIGNPSEPGLALGRITNGTFYYQKRNPKGSIEIHDVEKGHVVQTFECHSQTFCKAASVKSYESILVTPSKHDAFAKLWDLRQQSPIGLIHGARLDKFEDRWREEGMLMSLSACNMGDASIFVACGMESGSIHVHDIRMLGNDTFPVDEEGIIPSQSCAQSLGKDPILCSDMVASSNGNDDSIDQKQKSVLVATGSAADAAEQLDLPHKDRGTVALVKAHSISDSNSWTMKSRKRAQVGTCKITDDWLFGGKPGVNTIKFRPDGSVFAIGGWDKRVRIYSRTSANLLSILRGPNNESITAIDWVCNNQELEHAGVLAAGSADGMISIWRAFPH